MVESYARMWPAGEGEILDPRAYQQGMLQGFGMCFAAAARGQMIRTGDDLEALDVYVRLLLNSYIKAARARLAPPKEEPHDDPSA